MITAAAQPDFWHPLPDDTVMHAPPKDIMLSFNETQAASLTIAIPTFRRPLLMQATLRSILAQTNLGDLCVIVLDNDPASDGHTSLLNAMPELSALNFRYYRNHENIGLFGNWNACIAAANTKWVTVLNDDDLLDPEFVDTMLGVLAKDPSIDALACSMREFDTRGETSRKRKPSYRDHLKNVARFGLRDRVMLTPKALFFRNVGGSSLGLIAKPEVFRAAGGYLRDQYPAADHFLNVRLARRFKFVRLKQVLTLVRLEENVSARRDVMLDLLGQGREIQLALLKDHEVPQWWDRFSGRFFRMVINEWNARWGVNLGGKEVEERTGLVIPKRIGPLTKFVSLALRAF